MAELTTTSYVILGLLASRDFSAYELAEQAGRGLSDIWPRRDRQLYAAPKTLVELGLASTRREATGRRGRTVYSITPAGEAALTDWLVTGTQPPELQFEALIRVLLADRGSVDDLRTSLEATIEQARGLRDLYAAHATYIIETGGTFPERRHLFALANRFMIGHFSQVIDWATWALDEIESWPDTTSPLDSDDERTLAILRSGARSQIARTNRLRDDPPTS